MMGLTLTPDALRSGHRAVNILPMFQLWACRATDLQVPHRHLLCLVARAPAQAFKSSCRPLWRGQGSSSCGYVARTAVTYRADGTTAAASAQAASSTRGAQLEEKLLWDSNIVSNSTGLQLVMLGTSSAGNSSHRGTPCTALRRQGELWLFECGEDTQRQFLRQPLMKPSKVTRIFVSRAHPANFLGLPGMLCTSSSAREIGHDSTDVPIHIYGPPGLALYLRNMLQLSDTFLSVPIIIHEFVQHAVPQSELDNPQHLDERSCLFLQRLPPDQLHPQGWSDGSMSAFLNRGTGKGVPKGPDERLNVRPLAMPHRGNPERADVSPSQMTWTVRTNPDYYFTAFLLPHSQPSFGFVVQEAARVGALDIIKCAAHRVPPGASYAALKDGESVQNAEGEMVHSHQVLCPDRPGRKLAVIGQSSDSLPMAHLAADADVVLHNATRLAIDADGSERVVSCSAMAAQFAAAAGAQTLVLTSYDSSIGPGTPLSAQEYATKMRELQAAAGVTAGEAVGSALQPTKSTSAESEPGPKRHRDTLRLKGSSKPPTQRLSDLPLPRRSVHAEEQLWTAESSHVQRSAAVTSTTGRGMQVGAASALPRTAVTSRPSPRHCVLGQSLVRHAHHGRAAGKSRASIVMRDSPWHHWPKKDHGSSSRRNAPQQQQRKRHDPPGQRGARPGQQQGSRDRRASSRPSNGAARDGPGGMEWLGVVPHRSQAMVMGHQSPEMEELVEQARAIFGSLQVVAAQDFHLLEIQRREPSGSEQAGASDSDDVWN